jgi:DmsE family decaheme c-type cytochrome
MMRSRSVILSALLLFICFVGSLLAADTPSPIEGNLPELSRTCAQCHEDVYKSFMGNVHARLKSFEYAGTPGGCEACHGPAQKHVDSGAKADIISFGEKGAAEINALCGKCHRSGDFASWAHGQHARNGLTCTECHTVHKGNGKPSTDEITLCGKCHEDARAQMFFPSHHPVREGKMQCSSCHNPHGTDGVGSLRTAERKNDLCYNCHSRYQGPFVYEHAPVMEDCGICHDAHGTAANNLLRQNEPFVCLQCHSLHFHAGRVGDTGTQTIHPGTSDNPWGAQGWAKAYGTKCSQCHSQIHGSDHPSQSLPGRGKFMTR